MSQHRPNGDARVAIVTLGCGRNEVDSDQLAGLFHHEGYDLVEDAEGADLVVVNTCSFIEPAKRESIDTILAACDLKSSGTHGVVVTGCLAQRYAHELAEELPEADAIVGFAGYPTLPALADDILAGRPHERVVVAEPGDAGAEPRPSADPPGDVGNGRAGRLLPLLAHGPGPQPGPPVERPGTSPEELERMPASGPRFPVRRYGRREGPSAPWAYLKIAGGCDRSCTFCAIPSFRGPFRSRPLDEIVAEARWLVERGARELVLVSENTTSWGKDLEGGRDLQPRLLAALSGIEGLRRIRLMYLQPSELTWPLLEAMAELPHVCSYFDLSLQHVAAPILRRMARGGGADQFRTLVARIRELDPDAVFRSNFILGFPGETTDHVRELEEFLADVRLDWVGLFPFSREDGTPSADYDGQVPPEVAEDRVRHISRLQERLADEAARSFTGRRLEVTVEEQHEGEPGWCAGRSYREAPGTDGEVRLVTPAGEPADLPVGRTVTAEVVEAVGVDLVAGVAPDRA